MKTYIYGLICPIKQQLCYIGKANNPERRLKDHMLDVRDMSVEKEKWIKQLKRKKLKPILEILDVVSVYEWQYWESWWNEYFRSLGIILLNKHKGGNGLTFSNSQTFKKGNVPWNRGLKTKVI